MFPKWPDYVFNVTRLISYELKLAWSGCSRAVLDQYNWTKAFLINFEDSEDYYSYPVSLLQTMLSQIVYLTQLNVAMQAATDADDQLTFYYLLGRIMRSILIIDPLPVDQLDDDFEDDILQFDEVDESQTGKNLLKQESTSDDNTSISAPDYVSAEDMNTFFIVLFMLQGIEETTFDVTSDFAATRCGEVGWLMADTVISSSIPQAKTLDYDGFITSTTLFLAEVDTLAIHCIDTAYDYDKATDDYKKTLTDSYYLLLNMLYNTQYLFESSTQIYSSFATGFNG